MCAHPPETGPSDRDRPRHAMPRTRIDFKSLTLIEDEESGDTHMAIYATVTDSGGSTVAQFQWNNANNTVNEVNIYSMNNDAGNNNGIDFENLVLFEDEESGNTHMAIYVRAKGPGIDQEIFRWNNGGAKVNEVASYSLGNSPGPTEVTLLMTGPTAIIVEGYADDDQDWPSSGSNENALGTALIVVDPSDPGSAGQRQLGPTITDNGNTGYVVNASLDILPATPQPDLSIAGIEVTQAIQHFHSTLGQDNSVPLVAKKLTLVRAYIDSGVDPSVNNGQVPNVTGTLTVSGDASFTVNTIAVITAQPIASV